MNNKINLTRTVDIYHPSESIINAIRRVCYNVDDLSKIHNATESMLEELRCDKFAPTLQQQLMQITQQNMV